MGQRFIYLLCLAFQILGRYAGPLHPHSDGALDRHDDPDDLVDLGHRLPAPALRLPGLQLRDQGQPGEDVLGKATLQELAFLPATALIRNWSVNPHFSHSPSQIGKLDTRPVSEEIEGSLSIRSLWRSNLSGKLDNFRGAECVGTWPDMPDTHPSSIRLTYRLFPNQKIHGCFGCCTSFFPSCSINPLRLTLHKCD